MPAKGVVAAGHELTVGAAEIILREGGNAYDAILAAHFAACVTEPVLCSLGGGGFLLAQPHDREPILYDFFVQTPRCKRPTSELDFRPIWADFGTAQQEFHVGQGTIAAPGSVKGIFQIHRELGSLPLSVLVEPAARIAREGVTLNALQAYIFSVVRPIYTAEPDVRTLFCGDPESDQPLGEGETFRNPDLADTLERLAREGEDLFCAGEIGEQIVQACRDQGGHLTREDLTGYQVIRRKPLKFQYRDARIFANPPPSSGGILIAFALKLLEAANVRDLAFGSYGHLRLLSEVMQLTNKARVDAWGREGAATGTGHDLLDPELLALYRQQVADRAQSLRGTTHVNVIDAAGNLASMTISNGEGCGAMVGNTGIMLNNMLGEEDLNLGGFHRWAEDQRMTSMMSPSLIRREDGTVMALGSGGSNRIRTALLQVIVNLIDHGMDVESAVFGPRIHIEGERLSAEDGFPAEAMKQLFAEYPDHQSWPGRNLFFGGAHTVIAHEGTCAGMGDPRRGGVCREVV